MTVEVTNGAAVCGKCGKSIPAFGLLYRVTGARLVRCADCARAMVEQLPSLEVETPREALRMPALPTPAFQRFDRQRTAGEVRTAILDTRQRQAGERA